MVVVVLVLGVVFVVLGCGLLVFVSLFESLSFVFIGGIFVFLIVDGIVSLFFFLLTLVGVGGFIGGM